MHAGWEKDARQLLQRLEHHWRPHFAGEELRNQLRGTLRAIKRALARDSAEAREVVKTYRRVLRREAGKDEVERANRALLRFLRDMGVVTVGILPMSFITLPALFALAHHLGIELLPDAGDDGAGKD
ncbi:MAG TPA: hypothetical protein ENK05_01505 [Gammaproteobacteria bacterium]|nr:hypothetical protein [Gammaproteobacteria bacterium]